MRSQFCCVILVTHCCDPCHYHLRVNSMLALCRGSGAIIMPRAVLLIHQGIPLSLIYPTCTRGGIGKKDVTLFPIHIAHQSKIICRPTIGMFFGTRGSPKNDHYIWLSVWCRLGSFWAHFGLIWAHLVFINTPRHPR